MGDVLRVKFWQDVCCGDCPLIETFPNLYCIAMAKNVFVLDCFKDCEPRFWYSDWGLEVVYEFFELMYGMEIN